jgi:hypothetical protein
MVVEETVVGVGGRHVEGMTNFTYSRDIAG